jgi:hypothetical protein
MPEKPWTVDDVDVMGCALTAYVILCNDPDPSLPVKDQEVLRVQQLQEARELIQQAASVPDGVVPDEWIHSTRRETVNEMIDDMIAGFCRVQEVFRSNNLGSESWTKGEPHFPKVAFDS